jgi:hypothetical protein
LISDLTYIVVAHSEIQPYDTNICIDWAIEMMVLGYETPSLLMLSSFNKSRKYYTSYFEMIDYLNHSISELGLELKEKEDAVLSYSSYFIKQIAEKRNVRDSLKGVFDFYEIDYSYTVIEDFRLLYWAWQDIEDIPRENSHYWPSANASNIEHIVVELAQNWIKKYEIRYKQDISKNKTSTIISC